MRRKARRRNQGLSAAGEVLPDIGLFSSSNTTPGFAAGVLTGDGRQGEPGRPMFPALLNAITSFAY